MASRKLAQERGMRVMQKQCASSVEEGSPPHRTRSRRKSPLPRVRLCDSLECTLPSLGGLPELWTFKCERCGEVEIVETSQHR
jgi:hypothetical protein